MTDGMKVLSAFLLIFRISQAAPTLAPQDTVDQTIRRATSLNTSSSSIILDSSYSTNQATDFVNATFEKSPSINCDGQSYGFHPDVADCMEAIQYFLPSREQITYAQRGTPADKGNVFPLPLRIMGDRALCYFQPILSNNAQTGHLSLNEMRDAAVTLLRKCGAAKSEGGLAINIGGDGNIALAMGIYKPQVLCRGVFPSTATCKNIVRRMPASTTLQIFGPQSDPAASVNVPHTLEDSDDSGCVGQIFSTSRASETGSWFSVWEAATAIFSKCLRNGQAGVSRGIGDHGGLFLTMTSLRLQLANFSDVDTL